MMGTVIKICGIGLILCGSVLFGRKYSDERKSKVRILETIQKTMCMMREKILHENALIETCMTTCGKMYPIPEGNLFEDFAILMEEGQTPQTNWKEHVKTYLVKNNLYSDSLYTGLGDLENAFAQMNTDSLIASLDTANTFMEQETALEKEKCKKEAPFIQKISIAIGILLCVILF